MNICMVETFSKPIIWPVKRLTKRTVPKLDKYVRILPMAPLDTVGNFKQTSSVGEFEIHCVGVFHFE